MSVFASTWEIERDFVREWADNEESGEVADEVSTEERSSGAGGLEDQSSYAGSTGSDAQQQQAEEASVGFFQGFGCVRTQPL